MSGAQKRSPSPGNSTLLTAGTDRLQFPHHGRFVLGPECPLFVVDCWMTTIRFWQLKNGTHMPDVTLPSTSSMSHKVYCLLVRSGRHDRVCKQIKALQGDISCHVVRNEYSNLGRAKMKPWMLRIERTAVMSSE